jgi:hypothetical protein
MATLWVGRGGEPYCSGCGARYSFTPWMLSSRIRVPYCREAGRQGSVGQEIARFGAAHAGCPDPRVTIGIEGIRVVDRRCSIDGQR